MSQLTFTQSERRNYVGPMLIALAVLVAIGVGIWCYLPHRTADLTIIHTAVVPTHTEIQTGSRLIGHETEAQDNLYVLTTLRIDNKLHDPLFVSDITATFTTPEDTVATTSAVEKNDLEDTYIAFPQLRPLSSTPLLRESTIQPGGNAEGMVMLHFPVTLAQWSSRKSATLAVTFYHHDPIAITIPKP
jgi:hypothetical protein